MQSTTINNTAVEIREAKLTDIESIMELVVQVVPIMQASGNLQWGADYPNAQIFTADIGAKQLWVATINQQVTGVIAICQGQEPEYAQVPSWDVTEEAVVAHRLAVSPHWQGKGIAASLLHQCEVVALNKGIKLIRLDTNEVNRPMQNLFLKLGYSIGGNITLNGKPGLQFVAFEKRLP